MNDHHQCSRPLFLPSPFLCSFFLLPFSFFSTHSQTHTLQLLFLHTYNTHLFTMVNFSGADIFLFIVAFFLPPLAVGLKQGCGADFLISIGLTLLVMSLASDMPGTSSTRTEMTPT
ncbi:MAG: hypothetical protein JOS17DRAFT_276822 [Linnemannia elongata]|nr:MAG: hypothetical protein JOS17DRAFT_276822 [Linnemannia elongata]